MRAMSKKRVKQEDAGLFESIRKPTAPPSKKIKDKKTEAKSDPSLRKSKHKKKKEDYGDL